MKNTNNLSNNQIKSDLFNLLGDIGVDISAYKDKQVELLSCVNRTDFSLYSKIYYDKNKEKMRAYYRDYYKKHKEKRLAHTKNYREKHKEEISASVKKYREEHAKEIKEYEKLYRDTHREEIKAYQKEYYKKRKKALELLKLQQQPTETPNENEQNEFNKPLE